MTEEISVWVKIALAAHDDQGGEKPTTIEEVDMGSSKESMIDHGIEIIVEKKGVTVTLFDDAGEIIGTYKLVSLQFFRDDNSPIGEPAFSIL